MDKCNRILKAYDIFRKEVHEYGRDVMFPDGTDPKKTYSWRYLANFVDRMDELGIDDAHMQYVIKALLRHVGRNQVLRCGISVLRYKNLLDKCYDELEADFAKSKSMITSIQASHDFVMRQIGLGNLLSDRAVKGAYPNLVRWMESGSGISVSMLIET